MKNSAKRQIVECEREECEVIGLMVDEMIRKMKMG